MPDDTSLEIKRLCHTFTIKIKPTTTERRCIWDTVEVEKESPRDLKRTERIEVEYGSKLNCLGGCDLSQAHPL